MPLERGRVPPRAKSAGSNLDLASTISSEFEEVHLEDMEHSASGEEVEWAQSGGMSLRSCLAELHSNAWRALLCTPVCPSGGEEEVVDQRQPAVVGKNVSAPRPEPSAAPTAPPLPHQSTSRDREQSEAGATGQDNEEPELSWRGTRQGEG
jgi:hypothetical protein